MIGDAEPHVQPLQRRETADRIDNGEPGADRPLGIAPLFLASSERLRDNRRMTEAAHNQHSETRRPSDPRPHRNNRAHPFPARPSRSVALR